MTSLFFLTGMSLILMLDLLKFSTLLFFFYLLFLGRFFPSFFKKDFIYLFMRHTQREAETQAEGEAGSFREPDAGFNPGTPGS